MILGRGDTRASRRGTAARGLFAVSVAMAFTLAVAPIAFGRFTASKGVGANNLNAGTLGAPAAFVANPGATVSATWTITSDTHAAGYHLYRSTTTGGPYTLIKSVTPRTAAATTDNPAGPVMYYYTLRSYDQNWESVATAEDSAGVTGPSGYKPCVAASNAADTTNAGDNNGYEGTATNACLSDNAYATDSNSGTDTTTTCGTGAVPNTKKDRHRFWGYALGLPASVNAVNGIQVEADVALNSTSGTTNLCAQLSWDGGTTWSTIETLPMATATETAYIFGTASDTWGHTWTAAQLGPTLFRVRIIDASSNTLKKFSLDYVAVQATYTP